MFTSLVLIIKTVLVLVGVANAKFDGGRVTEDTILREGDSPFNIEYDIIIDKAATLRVEPGVTMKFAPQVMMGVNGTFYARGTESKRIVLTKDSENTTPPQWPNDVRLVDERSVHLGRLQLMQQGKWRGVCANFVNWTTEDVNVACKQLGFERGVSFREYHNGFAFLAYPSNNSHYMLFHKPNCSGNEFSLKDCPGYGNVQIGSKICLNQLTVHLYCEGISPRSPAHNHWWGMEFYNSTHYMSIVDSIVINETKSVLQHVDIMFAGVDRAMNSVPAVRAGPTVPHLIDVTIQHCALDGTNFTGIFSSTVVHQSRFINNRGHGFAFESHLGRVTVSDSHFENNLGNGIKAKYLDGKFAIFDLRKTFCERPGSESIQRFPQLMIGGRKEFYSGPCDQKFRTTRGHVITLNILEMDKEDKATGYLEVYDGPNDNYEKLITYHISNGTIPQGISSTYEYIFIRFYWNVPRLCPALDECVKFVILVDSGPKVVPEFYMESSVVNNNGQHGLFLENVRNYAFVNNSDLSHNHYGAGIKVFGGAGDVHINASNVVFNLDAGVNITYGGGMRIFNRTTISNNFGNGVNITINETRVDNKTRYARHQRTEVSFSNISYNEGHGVRVGNFCQKGIIAVNDSTFVQNKGNGVDLTSCFLEVPVHNSTNFTVAYNTFDANYGHAIIISPLINAVGRIANNTFMNHQRHTILLDNTDDFEKMREFNKLYVDYEIEANEFLNNNGFYVLNVRLVDQSPVQKMTIRYNKFKNNVIKGSFEALNERTRAYAVLVISSSNIEVYRNWLEDPDSRFEIATHLQDTSVTLDVTLQWWDAAKDPTDSHSGNIYYDRILPLLFDQYSRYNLASLTYHPTLRFPDIWNSGSTEDDKINQEPDFQRGDNIGGKLGERLTLQAGKTYRVDRDITILPQGELRGSGGITLEFENSLGIFVQGFIEIEDTNFILINETTYTNRSTVRLVDGPSVYEGRVEVRPSEMDDWGTVCSEGWTITDASVVCQMMGLVIHPEDWKIYVPNPGHADQIIWRSNVACTQYDMDVMECQGDDWMDHSCDHTHDVSVRCYPPTWGGVRFAATAKPSRLKKVKVEGAGLFDPAAFSYNPGIKIDYNTHTLDQLTVINNLHTGIQILHNDVYANAKVSNSEISNNYGNGISTRYPFFKVEFCNIANNRYAGIDSNPSKSTEETVQLRAGIHEPLIFSALSAEQEITNTPYMISREGYIFLITEPDIWDSSTTYTVEFVVDNSYFIVVDILDWNPLTDMENLTVYDTSKDRIDPQTTRWHIEEDLVDFPIQSQATHLTFVWTVASVSSGRLTFVLRSKPWNWNWPFATLQILNTTCDSNQQGMVLRHYNQPSNEWLDIFYRFRWEYITLYGVTIKNSLQEALHIPSLTKYHELYLPTFEELQDPGKIAEIRYDIEACHIHDNGGVMVAEHNHVEFANNVWIWHISNNHIENNRDGGFFIELPKINLMFSELYNHSVEVNDTIFENNQNFEFRLEGFYCNATIARNRFSNNLCKKGCITITGTEKDFEFYDNEVVENTGVYITEINMIRHTPYTQWVEAVFEYNNYKDNKKLGDDVAGVSSSPTSYTLGIKGLQNITINRNRFSNDMQYELLGGQDSSSLEIYLDATMNYWGTTDQDEIQRKIFDFDDWNNYAIAEYYPFLLNDYQDSPLATSGKKRAVFNLDGTLGGRIEGHVQLPKREEPYIVTSDITVMPRASLLIDPGVEMQFYPNIGILVLGSMTANGRSYDRIKFKPVDKENMISYSVSPASSISSSRRRKRHPVVGYHGRAHETQQKIISTLNYDSPEMRLNGGHTADEGFIEFYNQTEMRWTLICDDSFNERTAEVVCRSMQKEVSNVIVRRTPYYDIFVLGYPKMHEQVIEWFWRRTYICDGSETTIEQCRYKQNYHLVRCMDEQQYVYLKCGPRNLAPEYEYWGNIRFSSPSYEHGDILPGYSIMEYTDIYGAGILHGENAAAVQSVHRTPSSDYCRISHCAWNGYDYIAPRDEFTVQNNIIENNNGYGIGGLILNGESDYENSLSSFTPLRESEIPYNTYGFVRMCTTEKLIYVKDRLLLYYKYRFDTIDCIKIIRSKEPRKQVAIRFLQMKLYNDTFYKNSVEMYNGEYFDHQMKIGEITPESSWSDIKRKYETVKTPEGYVYDTMGIRVTASAAYGDYGFIAEVVTIPLSPGWKPDLGAGLRQSIRDNAMTGNQRGAVRFSNVGELNPAVIIERCRIQDSGYMIYNLSAPPVMSLQVQNSRLLTVANNYVVSNRGGIFINSTTNTLSNAIISNITNNVLVYNTHGEMLHIEGHYYQSFDVRYNFIAHNQIDHRNVVAMLGISANISTNNIVNNTGMTMINSSLPEQVSITQRYRYNGIYDNFAIGGNHTTMFTKSAKCTITENFFLNTYNLYDLVTANRTKHDGGVYPELDASQNWWGSGNPAYVSGRIWDRRDDDNLIKVVTEPFHETNDSLVQGRCYPGWRLYDKRCYWYMGGVAPYEEAQTMCKRDRGTMARALEKHLERFLGDLVASVQENYNEYWRTWVWYDIRKEGLCSVLRDYKIEHIDCNILLPYICEKAPYVQPVTKWEPIYIAVGVTGGVLIILGLLLVCLCLKSRDRNKQRLDRRNSLRASRTSLRGSRATIVSHADRERLPHDMRVQSRKRPPLSKTPYSDSSFMDISGVTAEESDDSMMKPKMDFHRPHTPGSLVDYSYPMKKQQQPDNSKYIDNDLGPSHRGSFDNLAETPPPEKGIPFSFFPPRVENEIQNIQARPMMFDNNAYKNQGYNDDMMSLNRSMLSVGGSSIGAGASPGYPTSSKKKPRPPLGSVGSVLSDASILPPYHHQQQQQPQQQENPYSNIHEPVKNSSLRPPVGRSQLDSVDSLTDDMDGGGSRGAGRKPRPPLNQPALGAATGGSPAGRGYKPERKPRSTLAGQKQSRPPLSSTSTLDELGYAPKVPPQHQQQYNPQAQRALYQTDRNKSRETLGSNSSAGGRSDERKSRPKETDI